jgi:c(7)-type cytochrome triheme protein
MSERMKAFIEGLRHFRFWRTVGAVILALGLYATVIRFAKGLGAATNLTDAFPWGLWIGFDVLVGVGLAAGGFVIAATVHVFRIETYKPIARPAVLTAFLGYLLVVVALLFDLGRPYRIWHPLVMWNPHSVMFEVAWCVMLYTTVLALEFSPLVFERLGLSKPLRIMRKAFVPLVIVGVLLSTLHQSSLGTLYVIAPDKLHGLWYTPLLPMFFFVSAVAGGLSMTIFESFMSRRAFGKKLERHLLEGLARTSVVVLALYTILKLEDLAARGNFGLIFQVTPESTLFWGEMTLGAILPMILFATPRVRRSENGLFLAAVLTVMGFVLNRLNVAITGMAASSGVLYIPSWMELAVTMSVVTVGFVLFGFAVKHLPVFSGEMRPAAAPARATRHPGGIIPKEVLIPLWGLLLLGAVLVYTSSTRATYAKAEKESLPVEESLESVTVDAELMLPSPYTFPTSEDSPGAVIFDHESHVDTDAPSCATCHAGIFSLSTKGKPIQGELSYERVHEGDLCGSCHNGEDAFAVDDDCTYCHQED